MSVSIIDDGGIALINALVTQLNSLLADVTSLRAAYNIFITGGGTQTTGTTVPSTIVAQKIVPFK